jgi:hypothetical protein
MAQLTLLLHHHTALPQTDTLLGALVEFLLALGSLML